MRRLALRTQQVILLAVLGLHTTGFGASYWLLSRAQAELEGSFRSDLRALGRLPRLRDLLRQVDQAANQYLVTGTGLWLEERSRALRQIREIQGELARLLNGPEEKRLLDEFDRRLASHLSLQGRWIARRESGRLPPADAARITAGSRGLEEIVELVLTFRDDALAELELNRKAAGGAARRALVLVLSFGFASGALLAFLLSRLLVGPVLSLSSYARAWALDRPWEFDPGPAGPELRSLSTSMKEMTQRLNLQHEKEAELGRFKTRLVSLISHEVNNALAAIHGASVVLEETEGAPPEKRRRFYQMLAGNIGSLSLTVQNLLSMGRLESGKFAMNPRPTDIRKLVEEALERMQILVERKGLQLLLEFGTGTTPVRADPETLSLVFVNLISNAIKYTPEQGRLTIGARSEGEGVRIFVQDTGIGIPAEERQKILAGHYRTERSRTQAEGFGIGLSLARQILEAHESRLEIESEPGRGSRFSFVLPSAGE